MNQQLTRQETDTLSAYLDNALNNRERQRLEIQLQSRPEMRAALNELRQTQQLLRQTPILRVPRNFTLTPEMAGLRTRPPRSYPAFQWAFTLASLFFILVIAGEFFVGNPITGGSVAMAPAAESFALEEPAAETMEESAMDTAQANEVPSGERSTSEMPAEEGGTGNAELVPPQETPSPEFTVLVAETPTPTPEPTFKSESEVVEEPAVPSEESLYEANPAGTEPDAGEAPAEDLAPAPEPDWWSASPWRLPQIIFGAVVLISGLGLFLLRRRTML